MHCPIAVSDQALLTSHFIKNISSWFLVVDWIWPITCELYAPWLFPYNTQNAPNSPANWIRQLNSSILLPWSELYTSNGQQFLMSFIHSIQFMLDTFPACDFILGNILHCYVVNYANVGVPNHILSTVNLALKHFPWHRLKPTPINIYEIVQTLQKYLPECHAFLGFVFLRVTWTPWLHNNLSSWDYSNRQNVLAAMLQMIVKLSFEPSVREGAQLLTILQEATSYPWHLLNHAHIDATFEWYVTSIEPSAILCLQSEHSAIDNAVLK